jgi:hypothetical protein
MTREIFAFALSGAIARRTGFVSRLRVRLPRFLFWAICLAASLSIALAVVTLKKNASLPSAAIPSGYTSTGRVASPGLIYYVRLDGGSRTQCNGRVDAPYPGSGTGQPCAWDHPFRALPPGGAAQIAGGDTLIVAAGEYKMGYGAPGASNCDQAGSFDCHMPPIPSGPDSAHPTRILGADWDNGCHNPPQLWGSERPWFILNLTDASNLQISCFEITDHSGCVEDHTGGLACQREHPPYGDWASYGLYAEDSTNVFLSHLNIHGLASGGVHAGRLSDWTVEDVRIAGNGWVGWDGDLWDNKGDANSGKLTFSHWLVEWNGCGETYPGGQPTGCWGQEAGGYGDGVGTGKTGGIWIIEDSAFLHNTSDGLDLLYHTLGGSVRLNRVHAEGNAGNQVKITGQTWISNSLLVGNCAFFKGQPFTYWVDNCRALGNTLSLALRGEEQISILNSTFYGQGDGLVAAEPHEGFRCNGSESISARNSLFLGDKDYFDPGDLTFLFYQEGCANLKLQSDFNLIHKAKNVNCGVAGAYTLSGAHDLCQAPRLNGPLSGLEYGMIPGFGSPAIDGGDNATCAAAPVNNLDLLGKVRPKDGDGNGQADCDIGAYEIQAPLKRTTLRSRAAKDGWVLESGETSNKGGSLNAGATSFFLGDDDHDRQYRAILSFNTAGLPDNAVITKVTLKINKQNVIGNDPFKTHGNLLVDIRKGAFSGKAALQLTDFQALASKNKIGAIPNKPRSNWYAKTWKSGIFTYINNTGVTQFRLRFTKDDNDDRGNDYVKFFSGNAAAAYRPKLIVEYYVP